MRHRHTTFSRRHLMAMTAALTTGLTTFPRPFGSSLAAGAAPVASGFPTPVLPATLVVPWVDPGAIPRTLSEDASPRFRAVASALLATMAEAGVPGAALGILYAGQEEHGVFGIESVETNHPVSAQTRFQLASLTKPFTVTAILRLIAQGKLDLDATVRTFMPDFHLADEGVAARVTLRHLLTHTGGWWSGYDVDTGNDEAAIARFLSRQLPTLPQLAPLGAFFSYNNTGFTILGHLIELGAGQAYRSAMTELVLEPLAIGSTTFAPAEILAGPHADGHAVSDDTIRRQQPLFLPRNSDPDGGLWSTTGDLLRFARFHLGNGGNGAAVAGERLLHPYTVEFMRTPQVAIPGLSLRMGMSWFILDQLDLRFVTHSGDSAGQHAELWMIPARGFALVLLTNAVPNGAALGGPVLLAALKQYLELSPSAPTAAPAALTPAQLTEYAGRYAVPDLAYVLRPRAGMLALTVESHPLPGEIEPLIQEPEPAMLTLQGSGDDAVAAPDGSLRLAFVRRPDGTVHWIATDGRLMPRVGAA